MLWIVLAVLVVVVAGAAGSRLVARTRPASIQAEDAAVPEGTPARALVRRLVQDGASLGHEVHRCRLDLVVEAAGNESVRGVSVVADLATDSLVWFIPGSTIDVVIDIDDPNRVVPVIARTRARATGIEQLPPVSCRRMPDQVYRGEKEREIDNAIAGRAIVACVAISESEYNVRDTTTLGLWVLDDPDAMEAAAAEGTTSYPSGYDVVVTEQLLAIQILELPIGTTVPVSIDPTNPKRVVVDLYNARAEVLDRYGFSREEMLAAAGREPGRISYVKSLTMTGSQVGVRHGCRVGLEGIDGGAIAMTATVELSLATPEMMVLIPGSHVVTRGDDANNPQVDLDATAEVRAIAGAASADWLDALPELRT